MALKRIILPDAAPRTAHRTPPGARRDVRPALTVRVAGPADVPWITAWTSQLGLPMPTSRRVKAFILLQDGQRVGHIAGREDQLVIDAKRQRLIWLVSAFIIPAARGRGLLMRFCEILSRDLCATGKVGARVAADNARMHKIMAVGGWTVRRRATGYTDYLLDLDKPFKRNR